VTVLLPAWLQSGAYTAEHDRFVGTALLGPGTSLTGRGGVRRVSGNEFQVVPSTPAGLSVDISRGMAFVQGSYTAIQGVYTVVNDVSFPLVIAGANPSSSRIDLVVLEVLDSTYSGASNTAQVRVIQGTPATNPVPPTASGSYIALAQVLVPANAVSIVAGNITDLRPFSGGLGAPVPVRNVTERNALPDKYDGLQVFMMDNTWEIHTYVAGEWYGSTPRYYNVTAGSMITIGTSLATGPFDYATRTVVDRAKIPDPGFRYMLRVDTDIESIGARLNSTVYSEATTTTAFSNEVANGQSLDWDSVSDGGTAAYNRLRINRLFPVMYTGNRWVTLRVVKDASESSGQRYMVTNYKFSFQITLLPVRPGGFASSASVGGQP
jgi:hypothetical protein